PVSESEERFSLAAVGGEGFGDRVAVDEVQGVDVFAEFAGLGVAEPDAVADVQGVGGGAEQRGLYLAGAFGTGQPQAGGQVGLGQAVRGTGAGGDPAAAVHGGDTGTGSADHGEREQGRRGGR